VVDAHPKTINLDGSVYGLQAKGPCTFGDGKLVSGAIPILKYDGMLLAAKKPFGLGRVIYLAVSMTDGPAKGWLGRDKLLDSTGAFADNQRLRQVIAMSSRSNDYPYSSYSYTSGGYAPTPSPFTEPGTDPFSAQMPATTTVVFILILYFVLVVPVNLLVLRKVGKGEWAWVTAPLLSLIFAAVFFRFSAGLYAAELSASSTGVVLAESGQSNSYFIGRTQMFFPRGGRYDLKFKGVEAILNAPDNYSGPTTGALNTLSPVDDGEIRVPGASVSNLAFREFSYFQKVGPVEWVDVKVTRRGDVVREVSVTNRSPFTLKDVGVMLKGIDFGIGDLTPGESKSVNRMGYSSSDGAVQLGMTIAEGGGQGVVTALISGFRPGPQIGRVVEAYDRTRLLMTFPEVKSK
jgi:hypothetical protein